MKKLESILELYFLKMEKQFIMHFLIVDLRRKKDEN